MRKLMTPAFCFGLMALVSTPAMAQGGRGGGMMGMGGMSGPGLLANKSVQKELKLSDEQIAKADEANKAFSAKMRDKRQGMQDASPDEQAAIRAEIQKMTAAETKKVSEEILKPEQAKRFDQISLQVRGLAAMEDPEVASKLKITPEQKEKLTAIQTESREEMMGLRDKYQGDMEGMMKAGAEMRKATFAKAVGVLSSEQKATWKEMTGEPFEIKMEAMRRPA